MVKDAGGNVVPRLTSVAATNAIIAGVTRLFRIQAVSQIAEVMGDDETLSREEDHRARWLVELAIAHLIQHGRHANKAQAPTDLPADRIRRRADQYLRLMKDDQAQHFADLLTAASQEYFLIVMLPEEQSHQFLTCEAPLIPAVRSSSGRRRALWSILPVSTEFTVDYTTLIPRAVDSYHVTMDVPEEIDVRRFILLSNADRPAVEDLGRRIKAVAAKATEPDADHDESLTVERRELETALGVLGQRRLIDVRGFTHYLHKRSMARRGHRAWKASVKPSTGIRTQSVDGLAVLRGADADVGFNHAAAGALLPPAS